MKQKKLYPPGTRIFVQRCIRYCEQWGITYMPRPSHWIPATQHYRPQGQKQVSHSGPGAWDIDYPTLSIIEPLPGDLGAYGAYSVDDNDIMYLVHEISHLIYGPDPMYVNETLSPMLALDYYGAKYLRIPGWPHFMSSFVVDPRGAHNDHTNGLEWEKHRDREWTDMPSKIRREMLAFSLTLANQLGVLDPEGVPTFKRPNTSNQ